MAPDRFEATFVLAIDRPTAWRRLARQPDRWLPGFDTAVTLVDEADGERLHVTKDEEPCAGTDILVTLEDAGTGTRVTVVQSGFGGALPAPYEMMAVGWRNIVSDLQTYLATGAHARRHLRGWGDLGAAVDVADGGLRITSVRAGSLADRLGLRPDDLLVVLAGAPVSTADDLVTVLRVVRTLHGEVRAEWVRDGEVQKARAPQPEGPST
jgi:S1-C subfamily serine protease